jgi:hypothetical protein
MKHLFGVLAPRTATPQLIAPGGKTVKTSLTQPDPIQVVPAVAARAPRPVPS